MSAAPLVTVYMPTRNRRELLERAVESVLGQTYRDLQLIVVNDGSSDESAQWLDSRARQDSRLRPIHHDSSRGAPQSRNEAILAGNGEFVTGLDDDDYFHPQRLARFVETWRALEEGGEKFSCLFTQDVLMDGVSHSASRKPSRVSCNELYFYNTIGNQIFTRRVWFMESGLFDESMPAWQDLDAFIRVLRHFGPARCVDEPLYYLSLDQRPDRISVGSKERILAAYRRLAHKPHASPLLRQGLLLQVFGNLYGFRPNGADLKEFFRHGVHMRTMKSLARILMRQRAGQA